jgi:hypothetical protein
MSNQRGTFAKRQREQELKDRAKQKEARRAMRRTDPAAGGGPQIAWDQAVRATETVNDENAPSLVPTDDKAD